MGKIKIKKSLFLCFVFELFLVSFSLNSVSAAEDVNYALASEGGVATTKSTWSKSPGGTSGAASNANDDEDSYIETWSRWHYYQTTDIMFPSPTDIKRVEYWVSTVNNNNIALCDAYLYYDGAWRNIGLHTEPFQTSTITAKKDGSWEAVSGVRFYVHSAGWGRQYVYGFTRLRELRAFGLAGPAYQDIGLRTFGSDGVVKIAAEIGPPNSPLRISKNGVIYGIALIGQAELEYGDAQYDSGVRIQTNSGIQALRRYP